jgi:hypothetical protein
VSTRRLLWTGSACLLLGCILAVAAFALQILAILASIFFAIIMNAPIAANGGNNFIPVEVPRVLTWGVQTAVILPLAASLLCFGEIVRRLFMRHQVRCARLSAGDDADRNA